MVRFRRRRRPGARVFQVINIGLGGIGGRPGKDGLATTAFPSGIGTIPVEVTEAQCPAMVPAQGISPGLGRRRRVSRWSVAGDRNRQPRGGALPDLGRDLRPAAPPGARPRWRQAGAQWRRQAGLGRAAGATRGFMPFDPATASCSSCRAAAVSATPASVTASAWRLICNRGWCRRPAPAPIMAGKSEQGEVR